MPRICIISFFYLFSIGCLVNCDHVPMVLWNVKGSSAPMRPVSAFEVSSDEYTQDLLQSTVSDKSTSMLVYVMDKLSMEDLAVESNNESPSNSLKTLETLLSDKSHVMFPSVKDPMRHFRDITCGVKDIHAGKHTSENLEKAITSALESSCVVIVHLGSKGLPSGKQPLPKASKKSVVGVFTASKSSWHPAEELHRKSRSLFAVDVSHFVNFTECSTNETSDSIILYADEILLRLGNASENDTKSLPFPPEVSGDCTDNEKTLSLTFKKSGDIPEVVLTFNFKKAIGDWTMNKITAKINENEEEVKMRGPTIDVPLGFSYSCGAFSMKSYNSTITAAITIERFQVQPFKVNGVFSSSFNCVTFFTLPIWMSIVIGILFIIILNSGIYALFNIKTMDRFDDPKGKTISVPVGTD